MSCPCGCCTGIEVLTPAATANAPGLDRLRYRVGTHGSFLHTMLARLSSREHPALRGLVARTSDDPAIALLDAWATVADVLAFYQERIANEGYLRTATERLSILELARLVGYELRPGVSATAYLAFTLDPTPIGDLVVSVPQGSRAQSMPGPGELPQSFETDDPLDARPAWSALLPRRRRPTLVRVDTVDELERIYLAGIATLLSAGDALLLVFGGGGGEQRLTRARTVTPQPEEGRTVVALQLDVVARFGAAVDELREKLADLRSDVPIRSRVAVELDEDLLAPLEAALQGVLVPAAVADALAPAVTGLSERLAVYEAAGGARGDPPIWVAWAQNALGALGAALEHAETAARAARRAGSAEEEAGAAPALAGSNGAGAALLGLGALLGRLRVPGSVPPPSARDLRRDPTALFAPDSDLVPQVLVALSPSLGPSLYHAWGSAQVTPPAALHSVQALRVRAAPFGATAPLKPVLDSRGVAVGSEEWPLDGEMTFEVQVDYVEAEIHLTAARDGISASADLDPVSTTDVPLGFASADVEATGWAAINGGPLGVTVTFTADGLTRKVQTTNSQGTVTVTFDDDPDLEFTPDIGQTLRSEQPGRRLGVELTAHVFEGPTVVPGKVITSDATLAAPDPRVLPLDAQYDQIVPDTWVVVQRPDRSDAFAQVITRITRVDTVALAAYGLTAKITRLTLADPWLTTGDLLLSDVRKASVLVQSEPLELAEEEIEDDICGDSIELDRLYDGLQAGRWAIISGERTDIPGTTGVQASELVMLGGILQRADPDRPGDTVHTTLQLARPLSYCYRRATAVVRGNVAKASHGETRSEALGSGDATRAGQSFALRAKPLTFRPASTPRGFASTLEVRVDGVRWHEAPGLARLGPTDHAYAIRTADDDTTSVIMGDGVNGARLTTGIENVQAVYRTQTGRAGNVRAGQISQLATRPLGVSGVTNPLAATGGADRESRDAARANVPLALTALDRLVSVSDYEDFTRLRAGIGKASARRLADGERSVVHLTIAGADDVPIDPSSDLFVELRRSLGENGDPFQPTQVAVRELLVLVISARVGVLEDYVWSLVEPAVRSALLDRFGFARRELGQDVLLGEVIATIQAVRGVDYVDVDVLDVVPESITPAELLDLASQLVPPPRPRIPVEPARFEERRSPVVAGDTLTTFAARAGITVGDLVELNPGLVAIPSPPAELVVARGLRPAQIATTSPALADTLILSEISR
jgi:predicted phage baseplate assembly protein